MCGTVTFTITSIVSTYYFTTRSVCTGFYRDSSVVQYCISMSTSLDDSTLSSGTAIDDDTGGGNEHSTNDSNSDQLLEGSLIQRDGTIGYLKDRRFQTRSNFCADVSGLVKSGDGHIVGYLFTITRIDEGLPR